MTFWHILTVLATGAGYTILVTLACIGAGLAIGGARASPRPRYSG